MNKEQLDRDVAELFRAADYPVEKLPDLLVGHIRLSVSRVDTIRYHLAYETPSRATLWNASIEITRSRAEMGIYLDLLSLYLRVAEATDADSELALTLAIQHKLYSAAFDNLPTVRRNLNKAMKKLTEAERAKLCFTR